MKKAFLFLLAALTALSLTSCGLLTLTGLNAKPSQSAEQTESPVTTEKKTKEAARVFEHVDTASCVFADDISRRAAEHADPAINKGIDVLNAYPDDGRIVVLSIDPENSSSARDSLRDDVKEIYDAVLDAVTNYGEYFFDEKKMTGSNPYGDVIDAVWAVYEDYPVTSLYFSDGGGYDTHRPRYFLPNDLSHECGDLDAVRSGVDFYNAVFDRIIERMPEGLTNYQKCLYFAGVVAHSCTYETEQLSVTDPFQAFNALVKGEAVCQGYTQAFRLLCRAVGIDCLSLTGYVADTDVNGGKADHIWNAVRTGDGLRFTDVTWMDARAERRDVLFDTSCFMMDEEDLEYEGYVPDWNKLK